VEGESVRRYGSIDYARSAALALAEAASREFERAYAGAADGDDKLFVREMVDFMVERNV
jgi:hypothetical protein